MPVIVDTSSMVVSDTTLDTKDLPVSVIEKLESFRNLDDGWRLGEGEGIADDTIDRAGQVLMLGWYKGLDVDVFPSSSGAVLVVFYQDDYAIEITINDYQSLMLEVEKGIGYDYEVIHQNENATFREVVECIDRLVNLQKWRSSEYYYHQNTILGSKDSEVVAFKTPMTAVVFRSSIPNVS